MRVLRYGRKPRTAPLSLYRLLACDNVDGTSASAGSGALAPRTLAALPTSVVAVMRLHSDVQHTIVEARPSGKKDLTRPAILLHPSVRDFGCPRGAFDEMCHALRLFAYRSPAY